MTTGDAGSSNRKSDNVGVMYLVEPGEVRGHVIPRQ